MNLVDLKRYPIDRLSSIEGRQLIERCQNHLKEVGCAELPGFLTQDALHQILAEARELESQAYHSTVIGNAYLEPLDEKVAADHPKRMTETTSLGVVAYDQFPVTSPLRQLYEWDKVLGFLAAVLQKPQMYRYADPLGGLNIAVMKDGDYLRWHFDQTDFVTSIALQSSDEGGDFEFVPRIRSSKEENFDKVGALLQGDRKGIVRLAMEPGTFILFEGRYSIHRVTPIKGSVNRLVALLAYDTKPGVTSSEHLQYMRYGRTAKALS